MKLRTLKLIFGIALVLAVTALPVYAQCADDDNCAPPATVPEIGLGSLAGATALLSGGYLVLRARLGRKK